MPLSRMLNHTHLWVLYRVLSVFLISANSYTTFNCGVPYPTGKAERQDHARVFANTARDRDTPKFMYFYTREETIFYECTWAGLVNRISRLIGIDLWVGGMSSGSRFFSLPWASPSQDGGTNGQGATMVGVCPLFNETNGCMWRHCSIWGIHVIA